MRKLFFVIICLFVGLASVSAQGQGQGQGQRGAFGGTPEEQAKRNTEWMKDSLKLNATQVKRVDSINLVFAKERTKLRESFQQGGGGDRQAMMDATTKLTEKQTKEFEKVLTKAQMTSYNKIMEARRNRMGQGGGQRPRNN